jgi:hypothetical protein
VLEEVSNRMLNKVSDKVLEKVFDNGSKWGIT